MSNFEFLKQINKDLFKIAAEAEELFRDEYFEQSITQTRRLGENLCRLIMGSNAGVDDTFDNMLATLKDTPHPSEIEKEFIDDLYFIKKAGNASVHSLQVKKDADIAKDALECLERSFEACLNFAVYKCNASDDLLNLVFDEEMLMTGKRSKSATLQERYTAERKKQLSKNTEKQQKEQSLDNPPKKRKKKSKKTAMEEYEEYFEIKKRKKSENTSQKSMLREIAETILAGIIIYIAYLLFFNK